LEHNQDYITTYLNIEQIAHYSILLSRVVIFHLVITSQQAFFSFCGDSGASRIGVFMCIRY